MESRSSGRADGRGWSGRGDAAQRRGASGGDERSEPPPQKAPPDAPPSAPGAAREGVEDLRDLLRSATAGAEGERPSPADPMRGPGEAPWVRSTEPRPGAGEHSGTSRGTPPLPDLSALLVALEGMRGMVPRELTSQVNALVRELLLTLRALIDWYLERLEGRPRQREVEEIPID